MARKQHGRSEGSIFHRKEDGLWVGTALLGYGPNGKRRLKIASGLADAFQRMEVNAKAPAGGPAGVIS